MDGATQTIAIGHGWTTYAGLATQSAMGSNDAAGMPEGGADSGDLLENDTDPNAGATNRFTYTVADASGGSSNQSVNVTVTVFSENVVPHA